MSKEKQIEEIRNIIETDCDFVCEKCEFDEKEYCFIHYCSTAIYNAGYRKQSEGEWILTGTFKSTFPLPVADLHTACSICRWFPPKYSTDYKEYNFCPHCGAKMKGGAE